MGLVTLFVEPGKCQFYSCEQLAGQRTHWTNPLEFEAAEQGTAPSLAPFAYQTDYVTANASSSLRQDAMAGTKFLTGDYGVEAKMALKA